MFRGRGSTRGGGLFRQNDESGGPVVRVVCCSDAAGKSLTQEIDVQAAGNVLKTLHSDAEGIRVKPKAAL